MTVAKSMNEVIKEWVCVQTNILNPKSILLLIVIQMMWSVGKHTLSLLKQFCVNDAKQIKHIDLDTGLYFHLLRVSSVPGGGSWDELCKKYNDVQIVSHRQHLRCLWDPWQPIRGLTHPMLTNQRPAMCPRHRGCHMTDLTALWRQRRRCPGSVVTALSLAHYRKPGRHRMFSGALFFIPDGSRGLS